MIGSAATSRCCQRAATCATAVARICSRELAPPTWAEAPLSTTKQYASLPHRRVERAQARSASVILLSLRMNKPAVVAMRKNFLRKSAKDRLEGFTRTPLRRRLRLVRLARPKDSRLEGLI